MATIHTAGLTITASDATALKVLVNARHHAELGTVNTITIQQPSGGIDGFLVGAGIPLAIQMDTFDPATLAEQGLDVAITEG